MIRGRIRGRFVGCSRILRHKVPARVRMQTSRQTETRTCAHKHRQRYTRTHTHARTRMRTRAQTPALAQTNMLRYQRQRTNTAPYARPNAKSDIAISRRTSHTTTCLWLPLSSTTHSGIQPSRECAPVRAGHHNQRASPYRHTGVDSIPKLWLSRRQHPRVLRRQSRASMVAAFRAQNARATSCEMREETSARAPCRPRHTAPAHMSPRRVCRPVSAHMCAPIEGCGTPSCGRAVVEPRSRPDGRDVSFWWRAPQVRACVHAEWLILAVCSLRRIARMSPRRQARSVHTTRSAARLSQLRA